MQLRNLAKLSALVAGFAMASFLQFNFDISLVQTSVLTGYALVTALVVSGMLWRSAMPAITAQCHQSQWLIVVICATSCPYCTSAMEKQGSELCTCS